MNQRTLASGVSLPPIGFGTYGLKQGDGAAAISNAIGLGYRLIDTAVAYDNEDAVGAGVRASGVPGDELRITTKLPGDVSGGAATISSFTESIARLGVAHLDVYLIHWPIDDASPNLDSWRAMIDLRAEGLVSSIGVANFDAAMIERLIRATGVAPELNQIEVHPYHPQVECRGWLDDAGIVTEAWSPLGNYAPLLEEPVIREIAAHHGVTAAQTVLRWHLELGTIPIPKSRSVKRQGENLDLVGFQLTPDEVHRITSLAIPGWNRFDYFDPTIA
jgi:2,5-diketo-D-gluconate reductase A